MSAVMGEARIEALFFSFAYSLHRSLQLLPWGGTESLQVVDDEVHNITLDVLKPDHLVQVPKDGDHGTEPPHIKGVNLNVVVCQSTLSHAQELGSLTSRR